MGTSHQGISASDGLFMGPVRRLGAAAAERQATGSITAERAALEAAIAEAVTGLGSLMEQVEGAVMAATEAWGGGSLADVKRTAEELSPQ